MSDAMGMSSILADQVDRLLTDRIERRMLHAAEAGSFPEELWRACTELGLTTAVVREDSGGAGLSWSDLEAPLIGIGYHAAPVPLGETMIASAALDEAGIAIPNGIVIPLENTLTLTSAGTVAGVARNVPWAQQASSFVGIAERGEERLTCLIDARSASIERATSIGRDPRANVRFDNCAATAVGRADVFIADGLRLPLAAFRSAQIAGALSRALEMTIEHANTRIQFGKPIGKFQALQQLLAVFACEAAAAAVAAGMALRSLGTERARYAVAVAKTRCGEAATKGAATAHAIHGAIGVTEEHSLHYFTRRLWQWRDDIGSEHEWAEELGRAVLSRPGGELWPTIVSNG